jgi:trimeric autotransporter adhesin
MRKLIIPLVFAVLFSWTGCGGNSNSGSNSGGNNGSSPVLKSLKIASSAPSVAAGLTIQLTATGTYKDGTTKDLTTAVAWASSGTGSAVISSAGVLTGKGRGSVTVTASSGSVTGKMNISVTAPLVVSLVAITPASAIIAQLTQQQFHASAKLTDGSVADLTQLVTWAIAPTGVATISNSVPTKGLVQALSASSTTIVTVTASCSLPTCVAQTGTPQMTASLTVTTATPVSIVISPGNKTIGWGTQQQFTAIGTFSDSSTQDITNVCTWTSSQPGIVFITTSTGLAVGNSVGGPVSITASFGGVLSSTALLSVDLSNLTAVSVSPTNPIIANGTSLRFIANGTFVDGSTRNLANSGAVSWNSSSTSVATISSVGTATSVAPGSTLIAATAGGISGHTNLDVESASLSSIDVAPSDATIAVTTQFNFAAVGTFTGCSSCPFQQVLTSQATTTWSSSNSSVAGVGSTSGIVTGAAAGKANITATSSLPPSGVSATVPLTVSSTTLVSIRVNPADIFLPPGASKQYSAVGFFSDGTTQNLSSQVTWSSSNSNVATISASGSATGQSPGKVNIIAKFGSVSGNTSLLITASGLASLSVTPSNASVANKTAAQFTATGFFFDGSTQNLTNSVQWSSSNKAIATIGATSGVLTTISPGQTSISATFGSVTGRTTVTVTNATLVSIALHPGSATILLGSSQLFSATGTFSDGSTQSLLNQAWKSSDTSVAIISSFGQATSSGRGTTTISATLDGVIGTALLTVQ